MSATVQTPVLLDDNAVFTAAQLREAFPFLKSSTLRREIRLRRLRVSRRGGVYLFTGRWLREWIEGGELRPRTAAAKVDDAACRCQDAGEAAGAATPRRKAGKTGT